MIHRDAWRTAKQVAACILVPGLLAAYAVSPGARAKGNPEEFIAKFMRDEHIPGLSIAVVRDGVLVAAKGYGMADLETNTPATAATVYKTASLSKMVIADAVLLLAQDGKLSLDDDVSKYLLRAPENWKGITIRNLLTHTSGIVRDPPEYHPYQEQAIADVIEATYPLPLKFRPGEGWLYSNVGYYALAEIITKASGEPWDRFIAAKLFAPAHMTSTRTTTAVEIVPNRARGYQWTDGRMTNAEDWIAIRPSGAFLSTVLDLAKWDAYLAHGSPVSTANRKLAWTPATLKSGKQTTYGFGWGIDSFLTHSRIHHNGQFPGFRSDYERLDDGKLTVIVLANSDRANLESFALKIAGFYDRGFSIPPFRLNAEAPASAKLDGGPLSIVITAKDEGSAAPDSIVEMEIWDASGKAVYKQNQANENFAAGETRTYRFSWPPTKTGRYSVNVGVYGHGWVPSYAWKLDAAAIVME